MMYVAHPESFKANKGIKNIKTKGWKTTTKLLFSEIKHHEKL
jgi:hypothetical protein